MINLTSKITTELGNFTLLEQTIFENNPLKVKARVENIDTQLSYTHLIIIAKKIENIPAKIVYHYYPPTSLDEANNTYTRAASDQLNTLVMKIEEVVCTKKAENITSIVIPYNVYEKVNFSTINNNIFVKEWRQKIVNLEEARKYCLEFSDSSTPLTQKDNSLKIGIIDILYWPAKMLFDAFTSKN